MNIKPLPDFSGKSSFQVASTLARYRQELEYADNGPADKNYNADVVEMSFDNAKLTAKLGADGFQTRFESPEGVSINLVAKDPIDYRFSNLTSLNRSSDGTYTGQRSHPTVYSSYQLGSSKIPAEEAQFLFNLHDPSLKPTKI